LVKFFYIKFHPAKLKLSAIPEKHSLPASQEPAGGTIYFFLLVVVVRPGKRQTAPWLRSDSLVEEFEPYRSY
jgi:hypothetical protein